ncbi:hypothetical protein GCM10009639_03530 [Kitasatospora putterlickiae]|uniref:Uncharacterized protein n=1 Tax=Kitasatospora putterlickiae TaxID=221725 RepID=A0ABN1XJI8_9ACTN
MATLILTIRPALVAKPFHLAFTKPVVTIDGIENETTWGETEFNLKSGAHQISVAFRYRGQRAAQLAIARREIVLDNQTPHVRLTAQLGARNGSSFTITGPHQTTSPRLYGRGHG